jgi:hypothetical protein
MVERVLGKDEVTGSIPVNGSIPSPAVTPFGAQLNFISSYWQKTLSQMRQLRLRAVLIVAPTWKSSPLEALAKIIDKAVASQTVDSVCAFVGHFDSFPKSIHYRRNGE